MTEETKLIGSRDVKPCGCVITEYADNKKTIVPCLPCGLASASELHMKLAHSLQEAAETQAQIAQCLSATAKGLNAPLRDAVIDDVARNIAAGGG